jgi:biopolymer transport protein ExbD
MPRSATKLTSGSICSDINVTPLVDVCLVLLIIFMVVTPLLTPDPGVRLPQTRAPRPVPEDAGQLAVSIRADGGVHLGDGRIPDERLAAELGAIHLRSPDREVVVKGDREAHAAALGDLEDLGEVRGGTRGLPLNAPQDRTGQEAAGQLVLHGRLPQAVHRLVQVAGGEVEGGCFGGVGVSR